MKKIYIVAVASLLAIALYFLLKPKATEETSTEVVQVAQEKKPEVKTRKEKTTSKAGVTPSNDFVKMVESDLIPNWEEDYGCHKTDDLLSQCRHSFLDASSEAEARWMKRQGFPSKSLIAFAKNEHNKKEFYELLENKYPLALTVASLLETEKGNHKNALHYALSAKTYSNKSLTFPYRLYGNAYLNSSYDGRRATAAMYYYMAKVLGDSDSSGLMYGVAQNDTFLLEGAISRGLEMLTSEFNQPIQNLPRDERPES